MAEEKELLDRGRSRVLVGAVGLLLAPLLSYLMFEFVTRNLFQISPLYACLNVGWFFLFYLAVFAVTGNSRFTIPLCSVIFYVLSLAETFVVAFRSKPILLWEFTAMGTAMTVAGTYQFEISKRMVLCAVLILGWNVLMWRFPVRIKGIKARLLTGVGSAALICGGVFLFYRAIVPGLGLEINQWALKEGYEEKGYVLASAISVKYMKVKTPPGYSRTVLNGLADALTEQMVEEESGNTTQEGIQPVNLICIMNESLADLKVAGDYTTNLPYFPYLRSLRENTIKGSLFVPVFGSLTSNSEFEFLTGDLTQMLPANTIAYQMYVKPGAYSMVSTLKEQGYEAIALHPYPGENWNRNECYKNMGFDAFYDEEFFGDSARLRNYVSDQGNYEKIIELVEEKEHPDDRLFVFNVTMQNHGGYGEPFENFDEEIWLTGEYQGQYRKTDQFLSLMKKSDDAFRYLTEYFQGVEEPTMIVMFGDHQPSVEDEFYDAINGGPSSGVQAEFRSKWYQTPFVIWTNYEMPGEDMGNLGAVYLSSVVLEKANLRLTPYNRFLLEMADRIPVVNFVGCYDPDHVFYMWGDAEDGGYAFSEMLRQYKMMVYNHSLDTKKVKALFALPERP